MLPAFAACRDELGALCRRFHVVRLEVFGSAARGAAEPGDLDFLVEFGPLPPGTRADAYFGLREALETLFDRPVDLVMTRAVTNARFLAAIEAERTPVYAA